MNRAKALYFCKQSLTGNYFQGSFLISIKELIIVSLWYLTYDTANIPLMCVEPAIYILLCM